MKAGVLRQVNDICYMTVPDPELQPGDMLVKVKAATVCGTDVRVLRGRKTAGIRYPSIIGHEFAGTVVSGESGTGFAAGQAVCVCPQFSCGQCDYCKIGAENLCRNFIAMGYEIDGAFAEFVRVPSAGVASGNVFTMPEGLSFEEAALAEPLACVINGQEKLGISARDSVVILGAGPIGLLHVKLARHAGAKTIIVSQTSPLRRKAALDAGADIAIDPNSDDLHATVRAATGGLGADVVIVAIGVPSLAQEAIRLVRPRGRINYFAGFSKGVLAALDVNAIHYDELTVTGAFGLSRAYFRRALDLIATGEIEVASLLTHRFPLAEIATAMAAAEQGSAIKVAVMGE
jgi:L-iditol 2-dehydrogenase